MNGVRKGHPLSGRGFRHRDRHRHFDVLLRGTCIRGFHRHSEHDYVRGRAEYGLVSRQEKNARHNLMLKGFRSAVTDLAGEVTTPVDLVDVVIVDWATLTDDLTQLVVEREDRDQGGDRT